MTTIYYPAVGASSPTVHRGASADHADGPYPLIVFAHGHGGAPDDYRAVIASWVSHGYVVVAPAFPLSKRTAPGGPTFADVLSQPGDLSFVLGRVLTENAARGLWISGLIDPARVGAIGHSLGAWTVLALAANVCCRDTRVKAAAVLAGEMAPAFKTPWFTKGAPPMLFVHARDDPTVLYPGSTRAYAAAPAPKYLLSLPRGGHIVPYLGPQEPVGATVLQVLNEFLDRYLRSDPHVKIASPDGRYGTLQSRLPNS